MKIASIMRTDLIKIAKASNNADHPALQAQIKTLTEIGPYWEATEDEIEAFDHALDAAEAA